MLEFPKISIVTPSFNQGQYIEQTILSITEQGYENIELIIIDGGSTDNTVEVIKKYEDRIAYWVSEKDNGQSDAINKGLAVATGDIFNWINSDDYLEPGALQAIANGFNKQPEKQIMCGYTHCFYHATGLTSHTYRMGVCNTVAETIMNVEMNQPGSFYRTDAVRQLGCINESLRYVFDGELWFKFLCKYGLEAVGYCDNLIAHFRLHKESKTLADGFFEFYKEFLNIHLFIASALSLPDLIINYLKKEQHIERYKSDVWDFHLLGEDKFLMLFADKYKFLLYKDKDYKLARIGLRHSLMQVNKTAFRSQLLLGIKLSMPNFMIDRLRRFKSGKV